MFKKKKKKSHTLSLDALYLIKPGCRQIRELPIQGASWDKDTASWKENREWEGGYLARTHNLQTEVFGVFLFSGFSFQEIELA